MYSIKTLQIVHIKKEKRLQEVKMNNKMGNKMYSLSQTADSGCSLRLRNKRVPPKGMTVLQPVRERAKFRKLHQ